MPRATVSQDLVHKDLKSLEGGWVKLRQLSFDQMLQRRDNALRMSMEQETGRGSRNRKQRIDLEQASQWTRQYEFQNCIAEHNLEDDNGNPLDFGNPMTLRVLDPKVGQEIEEYIEELNQESDEESYEDFTKRLSSSSETNGTEPSSSTETS